MPSIPSSGTRVPRQAANTSKESNSRSETSTWRPGPADRTVLDSSGTVVHVPADWGWLPPGDPMWTRRVKTRGPHWVVQEKVGRKVFSRGIWAPAATITEVKIEVDAQRSTASYAAGLAKAAERRGVEQARYVDEFQDAILDFLAFAPKHQSVANSLAIAVAQHATPVGSGTVARTERIPVSQRAESAVIAWLRHQTTAYDHMTIRRQKGVRRQVRRELAEQSRQLLSHYRAGKPIASDCPLRVALEKVKS
ncbi:MAG: DUF2293 domain-containing protein [Planctomycetota bacterium]